MTDRAAAEAKARAFNMHGVGTPCDCARCRELADLLLSWGEEQSKAERERVLLHAAYGLAWREGCDAYPPSPVPAYSYCKCPKLPEVARLTEELAAAKAQADRFATDTVVACQRVAALTAEVAELRGKK